MNGLIEFLNRAAAGWWDWTVASTWQGSVLLGLVVAALFCVRRVGPGLRYGLLLVVLLKLAMPPVIGVSNGFSDLLSRATTPALPVSMDGADVSVMAGPSTIVVTEAAEQPTLAVTRATIVSQTGWLLLLALKYPLKQWQTPNNQTWALSWASFLRP